MVGVLLLASLPVAGVALHQHVTGRAHLVENLHQEALALARKAASTPGVATGAGNLLAWRLQSAPAGTVAVLIDPDGRPRFTYPPELPGGVRLPVPAGLVPDEEGSGGSVHPDGEGRRRAWAAVAAPEAPAGTLLAVAVPAESALIDGEARLRRDLALVWLATVLAMIAAWASLDLLLLRDVNRLATVARRIGDGHLDAASGIRGGANEVRELASALDQMADKLGRREHEWRVAESRLRESEANLRLAQRVGNVGSWHYDLVEDTLDWSEELYRIFRVDPATFRPTAASAPHFVHPDDRDLVISARHEALHAGREFRVDYRVVLPDGSERIVSSRALVQHDANGRPVAMIGTVHDITDRIAAEKAIADSEQRERARAAELSAVLDAVPAAVWIAHDTQGTRLTGNRAAHALLDTTVQPTDEQAPGGSELFPVDTAVFKDQIEIPPYELPIQVAAGLGIEVRDFEQQLVFRDGRTRTVFGNATPLLDRESRARGAVAAFMDITDFKKTEEALRAEKRRAEVTLASIADAVIVTDDRGQVEYLNPVAESLLGIPAAQAEGRPFSTLCRIRHEIHGADPVDLATACISRNGRVELNDQHVLERVDGTEVFVDASAAPLRDAAGTATGCVLVLHDMTQQRTIALQISWQATHDALTGLINRVEFERRLARVLDSAREDPGRVHAVAYLDLDQFKVVNDSCGHAAGDELLRQLAGRLHERLRKRDTIARLGGDEFGLLLEDCPPEQAMRIAGSLVKAVADYRFNWQGKFFSLGVSIGLVVIDSDAGSAAAVMSAADAACYEAKERGRNRVHAWHPDDAELSRRQGEAQWVERLRGAIESNRLQVDAQPIVPLGPSVPGVTPRRRLELLLRVIDEQGGVVPPGAFIPAAERFRLMPQFDRWMVRRALQWLAAEQAASGSASLPVCSINLSGTTIADDTLIPYIRDQFRSAGVPASCLCFEITETVAVTNLPQASHVIAELRAMGCSFALDDFGSGMSSFAYLKHLRVDFLKIDGSFVRDMVDDPIDCAMVEAINRVGQVMGIRTIAEHAEDERIVQKLRELGVDYAQGTGICAPQPLPSLLSAAAQVN